MIRLFAALIAVCTAVPLLAARLNPADGLSVGYKAIASSAGSGVSAGHTGYGPGWIALTFDTSGQPHGPITGYLFHDGVAQASGNDHFDVSSYYTAPAASVNTPFAGGYAYGHFNGCTWSYLDDNGYELAAEGPNQTGGCTPPNHTTKIFCYDQAADPLCNAGTTSDEFEAGVWKTITESSGDDQPGRLRRLRQRRLGRDLRRRGVIAGEPDRRTSTRARSTSAMSPSTTTT